MTNKQADYWFPAKRYGWGWGVPRTWQGWVVLAAFTGLVALGAIFQGRLGLTGFIAYTVFISLALIVVCWLKGEPPRWRWGDE
jgi:hypothetical protein